MLALAFIKQRVILLIDYGRDLVARDETRMSDYEREIIDFGVGKYTIGLTVFVTKSATTNANNLDGR